MLGPSKSDEAVFHAFRRGTVSSTLPLKAIACEDAPLATLQQVQRGAKPLTVAKLRAILPAALAVDPGAALAMVEDLLGLSDLPVPLAFTFLPQVRSTSDVDREVLEATAAAGRLATAQVEGVPLEDREAAARRNVKEGVEALHALRSLSPQRSLIAEAR